MSLNITEINCTDVALKGHVVVGSNAYTHKVDYTCSNNTSIKTVEVFLVNAESLFKYSQPIVEFTSTSIIFKTDPHYHESADFHELELKVTNNIGIEYRSKVTVKPLRFKSTTDTLTYKIGRTPLAVSNMLYPRLRLGFPQWGTIEANGISNGSKLLEPLLTPFYDSYHKIIKYNMNSKFKTPYSRVKLIEMGVNPSAVYRYEREGLVQLHPVGSTESCPQQIKVEPIKENVSVKLSRILFDITSVHDYDYTPFENKVIYFKKIDGRVNSPQSVVRITGDDLQGEYLEESVYILENFFTVSSKLFSKINSITSTDNVMISNYLDCRYDHYLIKDIKTLSPIVDKNLYGFHPRVLKTVNSDEGRPVIQLHTNDKELSEFEYKFDIQTSNNKLQSLFIDEHLRCTWTDGAYVYSSTISHDLSKNVGNHPSNNNNDIISILDTNTCIGDWIDATIHTNKWPSKKPMIIQIKNKDSVKYYDQESDTFVDNIIYFYPQQAETTIEISVKAENDSPYVISVISDDFKKRYLASSHSNLISSMSTEKCTGFLTLIDNKLVILDSIDTLSSTIQKQDSDKISITLEPKGIDVFDWEFTTEGHIISNNKETTYPEDLFVIISRSGEANVPLQIELDRSEVLQRFGVDRITSHLNIYVPELRNSNKDFKMTLYLTDVYGTYSKEVLISKGVTKQVPITFTRTTKEIN